MYVCIYIYIYIVHVYTDIIIDYERMSPCKDRLGSSNLWHGNKSVPEPSQTISSFDSKYILPCCLALFGVASLGVALLGVALLAEGFFQS